MELSRRHPQIVFCSSTEGLNTLPWHWVKPTRSSNILPEGIFLTLFSSIPTGDSSLWLHGWALLPLPCYGARWSTNMLRSHALLGKAGCAIPLREHPVDHKWYHIEVPVGVPSVSIQCLGLLPRSGALPMWLHHRGCRLASLQWGNSNLGCPWAPKPHVRLPIQRLVLGSFYWDHAVRASSGLHVMTRLARGWGSLSLGTYDAPTSCMPLKINRYHTSLAICAILSERSEGGQPLGQRITRPRKSNNLTLRKDKTCPWRGQFELGNTWCTNKLSITDACTGWNTA